MINKKYSKVIKNIEKIRAQNNKNWMDLVRLGFKFAPKASSEIMKRINKSDAQISRELKKLEK
jgi:hypothetical protein